MGQCSGIKGDGTRCRGIAGASNGLCAAHDPARQDARRRAASRAGRSKPNGELQEIRATLRELTEGVISGEIPTATATAASQLLNARIRCVEVSRRTADLGDLLGRLELLEATADRLKGA